MVDVTPSTLLLEPGAPQWAQRLALRLVKTFLNLFPTAPVRLWRAPPAEFPPADKWPGSVVASPDGGLWVSDGTSWVRVGPPVFQGAMTKRTVDLTRDFRPFASIPWNGVVYDTGGFWSVGQPTRLTVPAGVSRVKVSAGLLLNGGVATEYFSTLIQKNGAYVEGLGLSIATMPAGLTRVGLAGATVDVVPGDYFEVWGANQTTATLTLKVLSWLAMEAV